MANFKPECVYHGDITPDENTIFVFGSNDKGIHGGGAAYIAKEQFGAIFGQAEGLQGNSYAIPTVIWAGHRPMPLENICRSFIKMIECAEQHPDKVFKIAYRSTENEKTLCGYTGKQLFKCLLTAMFIYTRNIVSKGKNFYKSEFPHNIMISEEWNNIPFDIPEN